MSEVFETNEIAYRACILYEAVRRTPVKKAYKNMKEVKPNVEYWDFEYWYYRFSNGQHDLNHDRSKDPKSLGLSDMPIDVVDNIVGYLGLVDKLAARKVCRNMRAVIDDQKSKFGKVELIIDGTSCEVHFEDLGIFHYAEENETYSLETFQKTVSLKGDHSEAAVKEFATVINQPKWSFEDVTIGLFSEECYLVNERKSILYLNALLSNHKIHVDRLIIHADTMETLATILPRFETDHVVFQWGWYSDDAEKNWLEVIEMDQWKKLTKCELTNLPKGFPIEALFHVRECHFIVINLTEEHLLKIRDILFTSPDFEYFKISDEKDCDSREEFTVLIDRVMGAHAAYDPLTKVYRIENSKDYIQISVENLMFYELSIQKIRS
ncbi:hypothetical protein CAEBREN_16566 [Caenorhabditis brenneri]|uniref:F-box domain-containing protein n=1 Tax=Caenorhabditis brenneri TaxID=135651 RepID=G0P3G0_CAEBE|nr:hypothetical protein CAEBREN_16566 [Caenorhabditis brenneri]